MNWIWMARYGRKIDHPTVSALTDRKKGRKTRSKLWRAIWLDRGYAHTSQEADHWFTPSGGSTSWGGLYLSPGRALSVCVYVCLSQPFIWTLFGRFWWNLDHMILTRFWDDTFLRFWKCWSDDVIAAILYVFKCGTLTVAILLRSSPNL